MTIGDDFVQFNFKPGQFYKYQITANDGREVIEGWLSLRFSDAGSGRLKMDYQGEVGASFSGSSTGAKFAEADMLLEYVLVEVSGL